MYKLNFIQYPSAKDFSISVEQALEPLKSNEKIEKFISSFKKRFNFKSLNTFSFSEDGFLSMMLNLGGKIQVSKGESQAIVDAALKCQELGFDIEFISLNKDGLLNYEDIKSCDYIFCSSYIMDTYVKVDLQKVKKLSSATVISNISATMNSKNCDVALLDAYKLTGFSFSSIILHNELLKEQYLANIDTVAIYNIANAVENFKTIETYKNELKNALDSEFGENIYYFVKPEDTLAYTLHFGLKDIKAREIIRTLSLNSIFVTNGEGCSLGLSKPSRIIQEMGYEELEARWALSLSFSQELTSEEILNISKIIAKKYRQIKALNG
ncbi:MAG: cysteine desulfurase [Arcobacter sp.]|nr:MAG: cysteine desulfurase [Arcobacter sp.]